MSFETLQAELETGLKTSHAEIKQFAEKANAEIASAKSVSVETKNALTALATKATEITDRLFSLEQKSVYTKEPSNKPESVGEQFIKSANWTAGNQSGQSKVRFEMKAAILDTPENALTQPMRVPNIVMPSDRRLTIRDLLAYGTTTSSSIEFVREKVFTNNAAPQDGQGAQKAESSMNFELATVPVATIAHWIPVSKQVLEDSAMLASYINSRMIYGLRLEEEKQRLTGTGRNNGITGLIASQTAYNRGTGSKLDVIRKAMTQVQLSEYAATGVILNPVDWDEMELSKATDGRYLIVSSVSEGAVERVWRLPAVITNSMPVGNFQVGAYQLAAQFWDRQQAVVEVSREDRNNFITNMVTILAEERAALAVYRPAAIVGGAFPSPEVKSKTN
ncbi:MAG: phage major capsid protein [Ottowia sp.]|nr:phage major capsid protein [Ottowia sp.]